MLGSLGGWNLTGIPVEDLWVPNDQDLVVQVHVDLMAEKGFPCNTEVGRSGVCDVWPVA